MLVIISTRHPGCTIIGKGIICGQKTEFWAVCAIRNITAFYSVKILEDRENIKTRKAYKSNRINQSNRMNALRKDLSACLNPKCKGRILIGK